MYQQQKLTLTVLVAEGPRSGFQHGWGPSSGSQASLAVSSHGGGRGEGAQCGVFYIRTLSHSRGLHTHDPVTSQRPCVWIPSPLGVRISTYEFRILSEHVQTIAPHKWVPLVANIQAEDGRKVEEKGESPEEWKGTLTWGPYVGPSTPDLKATCTYIWHL